jgi:hypothetical protein
VGFFSSEKLPARNIPKRSFELIRRRALAKLNAELEISEQSPSGPMYGFGPGPGMGMGMRGGRPQGSGFVRAGGEIQRL